MRRLLLMRKILSPWKGHVPFILLFLLVAIMNYFVHFHGDDLRYSTQFSLFESFKGQEPTLMNIIKAQIYDYFHINGRLIVHVFCAFILTKGIWLWKIINPLFVVALAYALFYVIYVRLPQRQDILRTALISSLLFLAHFYIIDGTFNYPTASFNYLYPMVYLLLLIAFFRQYDEGQPTPHKITLIIFILLGFITGWSQEQVSLLGIGFVTLWLIKQRIEKKPFFWIHLAIFFSTLAGALFLFLSPGPKLRLLDPLLDRYNSLTFLGKITYSLPGVQRFFILDEAICIILVTLLSSITCYKISLKKVWLLPVPVVLAPYVFSTPLFNTHLFDLIMGRWRPISLFGLFVMTTILIMSIYLTVKKKNYLYLAFSLAFILASLILVLTPVNSHGRIAFPSYIFGITLTLLLFEQVDSIKNRLYIVCFLSMCALVNYLSLVRDLINKS